MSLSSGTGSDHNAGPASPAAQDLNSKIAAVKTFWESDQTTVFDVYVTKSIRYSAIKNEPIFDCISFLHTFKLYSINEIFVTFHVLFLYL